MGPRKGEITLDLGWSWVASGLSGRLVLRSKYCFWILGRLDDEMHDNSNKSINVGGFFFPVDLMEYGSLGCPRNQGIQKRNHLMFVLHFHGELDIQVFTVQILEKVTAFVNSIPRMCRSRI